MATTRNGFWILVLALVQCINAYAQNIEVKELINVNKPFDQNLFPRVNHAIHNFTVMDPGIPVLPIAGGVYIAGWKKWLLNPSAKSIIHAIDYLPKDTSIYLIAERESKKMLLQLKETGSGNATHYLTALPTGCYNIKCAGKNLIYLIGKEDKLWKVWRYNGNQVQVFFESELPINDIATIGMDIVMAIGNTVVYYGPKVSREVIKLDIKVDGVAIDTDGTLYVSTEKGILHYLSPDYISDADIITSYIHGKLKVYKKTLYVLWREQNQILELEL